MSSEEKMNELLPYFNNILDTLSDGIYISDANGKTCKVNRAYQELTGLKEREIIGKLVTDLKREGKYDTALNPEIVKTGKPKTSVQTTEKGCKVILSGYPIFDTNGKVALVVTFVRDVSLLLQLKEQLVEQQELINNYKCGVKYYSSKNTPALIIKSREMQKVLEIIGNIAETDATVLLLGETGVGKDMIAHHIHSTSTRKNEPFFKVDCSSIPSSLIESELFGYEAGAFSGACPKGKPGYFEIAHKGTLFLDEIGELSFLMQAKLLRVLQDREILRVGSTKVKKVNTRIIAATNLNLEEAVKEGKFRADLYYRLRVAVIKIPSLRNRKEDILPLTKYFLNKFNQKYKKNVSFSSEVNRIFQEYNWPGNIRELENLIQSLIITVGRSTVDIADLPNTMQPATITAVKDMTNKSLCDILNETESELLRAAYMSKGSVSEVAKFFKVDRSTVFRKMKKYAII